MKKEDALNLYKKCLSIIKSDLPVNHPQIIASKIQKEKLEKEFGFSERDLR